MYTKKTAICEARTAPLPAGVVIQQRVLDSSQSCFLSQVLTNFVVVLPATARPAHPQHPWAQPHSQTHPVSHHHRARPPAVSFLVSATFLQLVSFARHGPALSILFSPPCPLYSRRFFLVLQSFWQTLERQTVVDSVSGPSQFLLTRPSRLLACFCFLCTRAFCTDFSKLLRRSPPKFRLSSHDLAPVSHFYGRRQSCPSHLGQSPFLPGWLSHMDRNIWLNVYVIRPEKGVLK